MSVFANDQNDQNDREPSLDSFEAENELPDDEAKIREEMKGFIVYEEDEDNEDSNQTASKNENPQNNENEAEMLRRDCPWAAEPVESSTFENGVRRSRRASKKTKFFEEEFSLEISQVLLEGESIDLSESSESEVNEQDEEDEEWTIKKEEEDEEEDMDEEEDEDMDEEENEDMDEEEDEDENMDEEDEDDEEDEEEEANKDTKDQPQIAFQPTSDETLTSENVISMK